MLKSDEFPGFFRNFGVLAIGFVIGQAAVLIATPLLTRIYEPEMFGALSAFLSLLALIYVLGTFSYQIAIPLPQEESEAVALFYLCIGILTISTLVLVLCILAFPNLIHTRFKIPGIQYILVVPVYFVCVNLTEILTQWCTRIRRYEILAASKALQGLSLAGGQIGIGLISATSIGLVLGDLVGRCAGLICIGVLLFRSWSPPVISPKNVAYVFVKYKRFLTYSTIATSINRVARNTPPLLFFGFYGATVAGFIAIGERLINIPLGLLARSISRVYVGEGSKFSQSSPSKLSKMFWSLTKRLFLIGAVPALVILFGGPSIFSLVFGERWFEAGKFAQVLACPLFLQFVFVPLSPTLNLIQRQELQLIWDLIFAIMVNGSILVSWSIGLKAYHCVAIYSASMFLSYALFPLMVHAGLRKAIHEESARKGDLSDGRSDSSS